MTYQDYEEMSVEDLYKIQEEISDKIKVLEELRKEIGKVISSKCSP